jgi:hypothetical protein
MRLQEPHIRAKEGVNLAKRIEVEYEGKKVPAELLEYTTRAEPWAEYELEDGSQIRIKAVLAQVFRVVGHFQPNGDPVYGLQVGNLPVFTVNPTLVRDASGSNSEKIG